MVSIFLGEELTAVLDAIENDTPYNAAEKTVMKLGVHVLPRFTRDTTDRNRTSPFAFTGNKFEFRMLGSSNSIACANIMLNTAFAESLRIYADRLEKSRHFEEDLHSLIKETVKDHKRIIFNGNGYDDAWIREATEAAFMIRDVILQRMAELRVVCDEAETLTAESYWPFPTYGELLFGV